MEFHLSSLILRTVLLGDRLVVGRRALNPLAGVRILLPQPSDYTFRSPLRGDQPQRSSQVASNLHGTIWSNQDFRSQVAEDLLALFDVPLTEQCLQVP